MLAAAIASLERVHRVWGIAPPVWTVLRSALVGAALYLAAASLPRGGVWLLLELPALAALSLALYLVFGEATAEELGRLRRVLSLKQPA